MNQPPPPSNQSLRRNLQLGKLLLLVALLAYLPSLGGGFSSNDARLITDNVNLRSLSGLWDIWRGFRLTDYFPLTQTSFWLEHHLWGDAALGYRAVNVALHGLSAIVLWRILERLKIQRSWFGALLYAIHPVCVNSVAWIGERGNLLAQLAAFLCVLLFLRAEAEKSLRDYSLAIGCFLAALLAKTTVVTIPPALLLLLWWRQGRWDWGWVKRLAPFFALALLLGLLTLFQQRPSTGAGAGAAFSLGQRLVNSGHAVWFYWLKLVAPIHLAMIYPTWKSAATSATAWLPALLFVAALVGSWSARNRHWLFRTIFFLLALHAGLLFPILGLFPMAGQSTAWVADHFQYLAVPVFCATLAAVLEPLTRKPRMEPTSVVPKPLPALLVALPLLILCVRQSFLHGDQERLWSETQRLNPANREARINLSTAILQRLESAQVHSALTVAALPTDAGAMVDVDSPQMADLTRVIDLTRRIARGEDQLAVRARLNLGQALILQGRIDESIPFLEEAARLAPNSAAAHCSLGQALEATNDLDRAAAQYTRASQLRPDYDEPHYNLGNLRRRQGNLAAAEQSYRTALRLNPNNLNAMIKCADLLAEQKRFDEATRLYEAVQQLEPERPELLLNLGDIWLRANNTDEAVRCFTSAIDLNRTNPVAWRKLANARAAQKRFEAALEAIEQAGELAPQDPTLDRLAIEYIASAGKAIKAVERARIVGETHSEDAEHLLTAAETVPAATGSIPESTRIARELARQVLALRARDLATPEQVQRAQAILDHP